MRGFHVQQDSRNRSKVDVIYNSRSGADGVQNSSQDQVLEMAVQSDSEERARKELDCAKKT
jgi:hypothetical protein